MLFYFLKRLLWIGPTLFGVLLVNFIIIQTAPGGPIDQITAQLKQHDFADIATLDDMPSSGGIDDKTLAKLKKEFGFDQPLLTRFWITLKKYICLDFGTSYYKGKKVTHLIAETLPVSISLGLWSTLLILLIAIPLGIAKAIKHRSPFDTITTIIVGISFAVPSIVIALGLLVIFAGGTFLDIFPIRDLISENFDSLSWWGKIKDYVWHITLPVLSIAIASFAKPTILSKNAFIEEIAKAYVLTARAKGASETRILLGHCFRNAILFVVAALPNAFMHIFFYSALLLEALFSLDGIGYLSFEATLTRDYPVMFACLYIFTLFGIALHIAGDLLYSWLDPRIDISQSRL